MHLRRSVSLLVIAALVGGLTVLVSPARTNATAGHLPPGERVVVFWRDAGAAAAPPGLVVASSAPHRGLSGPRSVMVAAPGSRARLLASLRADPNVLAAVPDAVAGVTAFPATAPNDALYAKYQWALPRVGMPLVWPAQLGRPEVTVAVVDTGFTPTHADLGCVPVVSPRNVVAGTSNPLDDEGHGTHVAGIITACTDDGIGVAGLAPGVSLMPVKVLDDTGSGYWSDILSGVDWAVDHGARIVNLSLGGPLTSSQVAAFQPTFDAAWAQGVTVVAASGNTGGTGLFYPASLDHVLAVAATDSADAHASFSTANAAVDIAAPGVSVVSTVPIGTCKMCSASGYLWASGTSMAAPHVAAAAAVLASARPDLTPAQIESALESAALDLGTAGRDDLFGFGRLRVDTALAAAAAFAPPDTVSPTTDRAWPHAGATGVRTSATPHVVFSEQVTNLTAATVTLRDAKNGRSVAIGLTYDASLNRLTLRPTANLGWGRRYTVALAGSITDVAGNHLETTSWSFTTAAYPARIDFAPTRRTFFAGGCHTGYQFSASGAVVGSKRACLSRASGADASARARISGRSGTWLLISNGIWAGYWVGEKAGQRYVSGWVAEQAFNPVRDLAMQAATYTGYQFRSDGSVSATKSSRLWSSRSFTTNRQAVINGRVYRLVANGKWAGYWLPAGSGLALL